LGANKGTDSVTQFSRQATSSLTEDHFAEVLPKLFKFPNVSPFGWSNTELRRRVVQEDLVFRGREQPTGKLHGSATAG
jgi:hypothetical protein